MMRLFSTTVAVLLAVPSLNTVSGAGLPVFAEAVIRGGAEGSADVDEAAAGYLHLKYHTNLFYSRKIYFQFDLSGMPADTNASATLRLSFVSSYQQRVQLWALRQAYPGFSGSITWNTAQANDTASNDLYETGPFTAARIGPSVLIPQGGTTPFSFIIPTLGNVLVSNRVTLILTGVDDAANNQAGLRVRQLSATLDVSTPNARDYDVYLAAGQSNMDGRGSTTDLVGGLASWNQPQTDVWIFYANPMNLDWANPTYNTAWQTMVPGFSVPPGFTGALPSTRFGPELSFARSVSNAATNKAVAIIKVSQGGTSLSSDWKPASGYMYATLTNMARAALQSLTNDGANCTLRGMIWHQGEGDGSSSTATYEARLKEFIAAVRHDFGVENLPFVIGELATNRSLTVRTAQFNVAQTIPYAGFASSSNLVTLAPDDPHFNSAGALSMGERMAAALEIPPVRLLSIANEAGTLRITGSGLARSPCRLLSGSNPRLPFSQWSTVDSNVFSFAGHVTFLQPLTQGAPPTFYVIAAD